MTAYLAEAAEDRAAHLNSLGSIPLGIPFLLSTFLSNFIYCCFQHAIGLWQCSNFKLVAIGCSLVGSGSLESMNWLKPNRLSNSTMKYDVLIGVSLIVRRHVFASKSNLLLTILF